MEGARVGGVRREVQSRRDDARCRRTRVVETLPRASIRGKRKWPTGVCAPPTGFATRRSAVGRRRWDDACGSVERERVNRRVPVAFRSSTTSHPRRGRGKRRASHAAAPTRPPMGAQCGRRSFISRGRLERPCFFRLGAFSWDFSSVSRHLRVKDFRAPRAEAPPRTRQSAPHTHTSYKRIHSRAIARARPSTHRHIHTSAFKGKGSTHTLCVFSRAKRAFENAPAPL